MRTATLPSLRVDPELRAAAESVLKEGESLSAFIENSVKAQVNYRKTQAEFIARGLASLVESERTGTYFTSDEVLGELKGMLDAKRAENGKR
ncbi:prevent-host-death protein [Neorhizobium sp. T786]|uniref:YlcI/YnfO family protein n=1 Tax=Pseudorhizobium xiangyangii TaxID=2883104 RepID=UPI001D0005F1|nr:YlcI/YnfO family protein [Neorhizobium xiangyangii]MCB5202939.1 prevent-host-death protein [Neorhizobium xiangyangii]